LFLVKFQASALDESHHLLIKLSCKSACDNLDAISANLQYAFVQPILQLSKKSWWPLLRLHFLYLHTSDVHQTYTRSIEAE